MSQKLKDLIRAVRACKTAAEERACITKELAAIRTSFKTKKDMEARYRNISKLMYVDMLGYPTHFGQMEVINMLAKGNYPQKRLGYLALGVLMDENAEVLLLATQAIQNDMKSDSPFVVGLALTTFGNIASDSMAAALAHDLESLMRHSNPYIKKKALCTAIRVLRKVPEVTEDYFKIALSVLEDSSASHSCQAGAVQLLNTICHSESCTPRIMKKLRRQISHAITRLIELLKSSYDPEHDVSGINDPFLQVELLQLIRTVVTSREKAVDAEVVDALTSIATGTESKGAGNAILYECVRTIMSIKEQGPHQKLGINILGKFLLNRDNNIRYVALNALCDAVDANSKAIQRHRNQIKDCLTDADLTIRYRALDLIYALTNEENIEELVKDLLKYLEMSGSEPHFQQELASKICMVVEKYAPSGRWHIDTVSQVMAHVPSMVMDDTITSAFLIITNTPSLQAYACSSLLRLATAVESDPLRRLTAWCVGEYAHLLLDESVTDSGTKKSTDSGTRRHTVESLVEDLESFLIESAYESTKAYVLTALLKIESNLDLSAASSKKVKGIFARYAKDLSLELQQRGVEFGTVLKSTEPSVRREILKAMPVPSMERLEERIQASDSKSGELRKRAIKSVVDSGESEDESSYETDSSEESSASERKHDDDSESSSERRRGSGRKPASKKGGGSKSERRRRRSRGGAEVVIPKLTGPMDLGTTGSTVFESPKPPLVPQYNYKNATHAKSPKATTTTTATGTGLDSLLTFGTEAAKPVAATDDFLADILGGVTTTAAPVTAAPMLAAVAATHTPAAALPLFVPYSKNGITITFSFVKSATPGVAQVEAVFTNANAYDVTGFLFKVAVPKYLTLKIQRASGNHLAAMGQIRQTQKFRLVNSMHGTKPFVIKIQVIYTKPDGTQVRDQATVDNFPPL